MPKNYIYFKIIFFSTILVKYHYFNTILYSVCSSHTTNLCYFGLYLHYFQIHRLLLNKYFIFLQILSFCHYLYYFHNILHFSYFLKDFLFCLKFTYFRSIRIAFVLAILLIVSYFHSSYHSIARYFFFLIFPRDGEI